MQVKRTVGEKGQVVLPKDIRDYVGIRPGSEVIFEVRGKEIVVTPQKGGKEFVEDFCNIPNKLRKSLDTKKIKEIMKEQYEGEYALHRR